MSQTESTRPSPSSQPGEAAAPTQPLASDAETRFGQPQPADVTRLMPGRARQQGWPRLARLADLGDIIGLHRTGTVTRTAGLPPNVALVAALTQQATTLGVLRAVSFSAGAEAPQAETPYGQPLPDPVLADASVASPLADGSYVYAITGRATTIGRSLDNMLALLDPSVSRAHAILHWRQGGWEIENIAERNMLWVDGQPVASGARAPIMPGGVLRLGRTTLSLVAPVSAPDTIYPTTSAVDSPESASESGKTNTNVFGPGVTLRFALVERFSPRARWALALLGIATFVVCALLTLDVVSLVGQNALAAGGWRQALSALTLPVIPVLGVALLVGLLDRYEREPLLTLLGAFLWGAVIAIPPSLFIERQVSAALMPLVTAWPLVSHASGALPGVVALALLQAANAGITEEIVKGIGLALLLLVLRDEFDNVTDGLIYGALVGAGFAMVENIVYFALSPRADLAVLLVGRVALGWLSHSTFTALFGAGLGYLREARAHRWQWLAPLGGLLAAIALHTGFDFVAFFADGLTQTQSLALVLARSPALVTLALLLAEYLPLLLTQFLLFRLALWALRREAAIVRT